MRDANGGQLAPIQMRVDIDLFARSDQIHLLHTMPGRFGFLIRRHRHTHFSATDKASILDLDLSQFPTRRWLRNGRGHTSKNG